MSRRGREEMSSSFLVAVADRRMDVAFERAISQSLRFPHAIGDRCFQVEVREGVGRTLVAKTSLPAGALVFTEMPLVAAISNNYGPHALRGGVPAVARALLAAGPDSPSRLLQAPPSRRPPAAVDALQSYWGAGALQGRLERFAFFDDFVREFLLALKREHGETATLKIPTVRWALGVASLNSHGTNDPPVRGVLGVLASMMQHSCDPSAVVDIGAADAGSPISLYTKRAVAPGTPLSISYVDVRKYDRCERDQVLGLQYGFACSCHVCRRSDPEEESEREGAAGAVPPDDAGATRAPSTEESKQRTPAPAAAVEDGFVDADEERPCAFVPFLPTLLRRAR